MKFTLYRLHVYETQTQRDLFVPALASVGGRPGLIAKALDEMSGKRVEVRKGMHWQLHNLEELDTSAFFLKVGRVQEGALQTLDGEGKFVERWGTSAPHTAVALDGNLGLLAVQQTSDFVAPLTVANYFGAILKQAPVVQLCRVTIAVKEIPDSTVFLESLRRAHQIRQLWFTVSPPNVFEATELKKAASSAVAAIAGTHGKFTIGGQSLDRDAVVELANINAVAGEQVGATILPTEDSKPQRIRTGAQAATLTDEDLSTEPSRRAFLARFGAVFQALIGSGDDHGD
jgi:hypothetical protein